jgi:uncharacterized protein (UPF0264 family)
MMSFKFAGAGPGLLVSVRSAAEACEALAGGADVIDVKEPERGSLGAADALTIDDVVRAVNGRTVVTVALGELTEVTRLRFGHEPIRDGVSLFKVGLAGCRDTPNWTSLWQSAIARLVPDELSCTARAVAVVYADWPAAKAPEPVQVLNAAIRAGCPALLVDTWNKSSGSLFDHWPATDLSRFIRQVRENGIAIVLAGSLDAAAVTAASRLTPDLIAVRTAACVHGRTGTVCRKRVRALKQAIANSESKSFTWTA